MTMIATIIPTSGTVAPRKVRYVSQVSPNGASQLTMLSPRELIAEAQAAHCPMLCVAANVAMEAIYRWRTDCSVNILPAQCTKCTGAMHVTVTSRAGDTVVHVAECSALKGNYVLYTRMNATEAEIMSPVMPREEARSKTVGASKRRLNDCAPDISPAESPCGMGERADARSGWSPASVASNRSSSSCASPMSKPHDVRLMVPAEPVRHVQLGRPPLMPMSVRVGAGNGIQPTPPRGTVSALSPAARPFMPGVSAPRSQAMAGLGPEVDFAQTGAAGPGPGVRVAQTGAGAAPLLEGAPWGSVSPKEDAASDPAGPGLWEAAGLPAMPRSSLSAWLEYPHLSI